MDFLVFFFPTLAFVSLTKKPCSLATFCFAISLHPHASNYLPILFSRIKKVAKTAKPNATTVGPIAAPTPKR